MKVFISKTSISGTTYMTVGTDDVNYALNKEVYSYDGNQFTLIHSLIIGHSASIATTDSTVNIGAVADYIESGGVKIRNVSASSTIKVVESIKKLIPKATSIHSQLTKLVS